MTEPRYSAPPQGEAATGAHQPDSGNRQGEPVPGSRPTDRIPYPDGAAPAADLAGEATARAKAEHQSLGELLSEVSRDISTLMRQEVELAKAEVRESATKAGKGAGMFGGAAVGGYMVLLFLSLALWTALGLLMGLAWSGVVVAVIWAIIAAILAARGKKEMKSIQGVPRTTETVKEIPKTLK